MMDILDRKMEAAVELVSHLRLPIRRLSVGAHSRSLAERLRDASCQLAVVISEARWREGAERAELLRLAIERTRQLSRALRQAAPQLEPDVVRPAQDLLEGELAVISDAFEIASG